MHRKSLLKLSLLVCTERKIELSRIELLSYLARMFLNLVRYVKSYLDNYLYSIFY